MPPSTQYGSIDPPVHVEDDDKEDDDNDVEPDEELKQMLLEKVTSFSLPYDADKGYRATELNFLSFARPHMRTFHGSWICFGMAWFVWFSMTPLLPHIQESIGITTADVWVTNIWSMVGTIVLRIILGPLCDQFGARGILTVLLAACAIPLLFAGLLIQDYYSLLIVRFLIGCIGGTLVPAQYWMTSQFVREVCGMAMAVSAGWGAMGGGLAQVVMGTFVYPALERYFGNADTAWRVALIFPALLAMGVAYFFNRYSDDCPLGNYAQVQRAGLIEERSAMDSFRSGILNLNAWFLFLQFSASLGIELTMESSLTFHLSNRFDIPIADAAAYASLFGLMNIFSRGLGGLISDKMHKVYSLRGRLSIHMAFMLIEGVLMICFIQSATMNFTLATMILFAIFGQMSMGTLFGIIPYVDGRNTGTIAGIVGAGGNVGAVFFLNIFRSRGDTVAFFVMATYCILAALLTPVIVIKGYRGIIFGKDSKQVPATLMVSINGSGEGGLISLILPTSKGSV